MANERVSQLVDLLASDIQPDDVFLVTDMSQRESKKLEVGQLLLFIENSGSFFAYHSTISDTASYVLASNIVGTVATSLNASQSVSSSWADNAGSSSYASLANTASYSNFCVTSTTNAQTASFLQYTGTPNGTASFAINSQFSATATTALSLFYNGNPNGTASYAISASSTLLANNATNAASSVSSSFTTTASYAHHSDGATNSDTSSISISSSIATTASYVTQNVGPKYITPITVATSTNAIAWTKFTCPTNVIPIGTSVLIVDGNASNGGTNSPGFIEISPTSASVVTGIYYIVTGYRTGGSGDSCTFASQATVPCSSSNAGSSSFYYTFTQPSDGGCTLRLVGYY